MAGKAPIAIIGPGNLGSALAVALKRAGYMIEIVISRPKPSSLKRARALAREVGADLTRDLRVSNARVVWFCVPDSQIAKVSSQMARNLPSSKGLIALHSSGALTSDELRDLRRKGAQAASVHPLMTFVVGSRPPLSGVPFAVEGDDGAVRMARQIVNDLRAHSYRIRKSDKAAYHAWGTFASPLLTSLLVTAERVAALARIPKDKAKERIIPIALQTIANYAQSENSKAFSGPIIRGDVATVRQHLAVLRRMSPARDVYLALARSALEDLPAKNKSTMRRMLRSAGA